MMLGRAEVATPAAIAANIAAMFAGSDPPSNLDEDKTHAHSLIFYPCSGPLDLEFGSSCVPVDLQGANERDGGGTPVDGAEPLGLFTSFCAQSLLCPLSHTMPQHFDANRLTYHPPRERCSRGHAVG